MAFEGLSAKLQEVTRKLRGKARITESDLKEILREVKLALLEADVNYKIVKDFIATIQEKALGQDVLKSLTPGQQVVKIVKDELVNLLGGVESKVNFTPNPPTIIMLVGLQGSGKTTTAGKLANLFRKEGKKPLLVACDVYRPAAIKQLQVVGSQLNIPVFANENSKDVVHIAKQAINTAISKLNDVVILDTAGRLHIDEELMDELKNVKISVKPHEILLVVDSMTGQDAVNVATAFNENLGIDGVVLTKLDGDTRGGAALSVKKVTGKPIKFAATGEKLSDIEVFHPERMASRILGMGDVLSIIEKAEEAFDLEEAEKIEKQLKKREFDLDDYLVQLRQVKKMGSFSSILKMIPGMGQIKNLKVDDNEFNRIEAIICSMTAKERRNPKLLNGSRRLRIAKGSGTTVQEINKFMQTFETTQKMMKKLQTDKGSMKKLMKLMCVFALVFVAGCGASSSTDEQKEVVTNFFDYVKECDITKLKKVASEDVLSGMDLEKMEKELSQYTEEEYGKVFVDETNKFKKAIFKDLFTDIKIKDIKADGDKTTVKVTGKQKDYSQVSFDQSELNTTAQQYVEEHQDELAKVYKEEGLSAYQIKVYDGIAPILYQSMTDTYKSAPTEKLTATFTLEKKNDKWIITGIDE